MSAMTNCILIPLLRVEDIRVEDSRFWFIDGWIAVTSCCSLWICVSFHSVFNEIDCVSYFEYNNLLWTVHSGECMDWEWSVRSNKFHILGLLHSVVWIFSQNAQTILWMCSTRFVGKPEGFSNVFLTYLDNFFGGQYKLWGLRGTRGES